MMQCNLMRRSCRGARAFTSQRTPSRICTPVRASAVAEKPKAKKVPSFPFTKIAGQEEMKLALLLNVVDPNIGGVLIMGDRGTGKSVVVRALVDLLPDINVVVDDPFNSDPQDPKLMGPYALEKFKKGEKLPATTMKTPLVELPLGATEDRICGTIDIEKALTEGLKAYEPGLLAKANRGILYVDEVNLLDDGLVDVVLDSAASGVNTVEREGVSIVHPAKFIMIGSGNPAEGEMRPQLLDRFGMSVNVGTLMDVESRTDMVLDRIAYEADPDAFYASVEDDQKALQKKLLEARQRLSQVKISPQNQLFISDICSRLDVDGLRGDLVTNRAAKALVAYEGRKEVTLKDIERIISMSLNHRLRKDPLDPIDTGVKVKAMFERVTNPEIAAAEKKRKEEAARKAKEAAASGKQDRSNMKAGAWSGLPGR